MIHGLSRPAAVRTVAVQLATFISYVDGPKHLLPRQQLSAELHRDRGTLSAIRLAVPAHDVIDHPGVRVDQVLPCSIGAERVETSSHSLEALVNRVPGWQRRRTGSAATARSWLFRPNRRITRRTAAYVSVAAIGAHPVPHREWVNRISPAQDSSAAASSATGGTGASASGAVGRLALALQQLMLARGVDGPHRITTCSPPAAVHR